MSETRGTDQPEDKKSEPRLPYEPPAIVWVEDYAPTVFGVSCARVPGVCAPLPVT
jgi:hypothetical protein